VLLVLAVFCDADVVWLVVPLGLMVTLLCGMARKVVLVSTDVLVDRMRGSSSLWYRVRINLEHVPARLRPRSEKPS
jgi:hypothetical protein